MTPEILQAVIGGLLIGALLGSFAVVFTTNPKSELYRYVPKGSVIVREEDWKKIEAGIAAEIQKAKSNGIKFGRESTITAMEQSLRLRKSKIERKRPYEVLGLKTGQENLGPTAATTLREKYTEIQNMTNDEELVELCELRLKLIDQCERIMKSFASFIRSGDI